MGVGVRHVGHLVGSLAGQAVWEVALHTPCGLTGAYAAELARVRCVRPANAARVLERTGIPVCSTPNAAFGEKGELRRGAE